jgi:lipopolysaccharide/colanic/teichoic acid biosynthesis glycosyltransferase
MTAKPARGLRMTLDRTCAALGIVFLAPLFTVIALAIKLDDGGPMFYTQWRIGKGFKPFRLFKFRSMVQGADRLGRPLTTPQDCRLTRLGRILRRYKLDELPQLINVVKGEMQLVGARPEVDRYVRMFPLQYGAVLRDRPGISDPASLAFRHEDRLLAGEDPERDYINRILPAKLAISLAYSDNRNLGSDLMVILSTVMGAERLPSWLQVIAPRNYGVEAQTEEPLRPIPQARRP